MHATFDMSPHKLNASRVMAYQKHRIQKQCIAVVRKAIKFDVKLIFDDDDYKLSYTLALLIYFHLYFHLILVV